MARFVSLQEGICSGYLDRRQVAEKMQRRLPQGMIVQMKSCVTNALGHTKHHHLPPSNNSGLTLNQRVQGSRPCTSTNEIKYLGLSQPGREMAEVTPPGYVSPCYDMI
jgi:hypothetical protein